MNAVALSARAPTRCVEMSLRSNIARRADNMRE
jgi:hypothetical protein